MTTEITKKNNIDNNHNKVAYEVLILGGGPAGLTAAIYTARAEIDTLVIAGSPPGGQLMLTTDVENFPGFKNGILGPELITNMRAQVERFGADLVVDNVVGISECSDDSADYKFCVRTESGAEYFGKAVIVATGASAKWLNLESEQRLRGKGVSACATCDGFFFKDKVVAVVGGGDAAMEEATYLTKFARKVFVLVRGAEGAMKASKIMQTRAKNNPKIEFMFNIEVKEVLGENVVRGLKLLNNKTGEEQTLAVDGLFVAIGHQPNTGFLEGLVELDELGYARAKDNIWSNVEGLFIAGDVYDRRYRQAITAAGYGCMAALDVERYLAHLGE